MLHRGTAKTTGVVRSRSAGVKRLATGQYQSQLRNLPGTPAGETSVLNLRDNTKKEAQTAVRGWLAAVREGDAKKVAALYAVDGLLHPTVSAKIRHNREEIEDYFNHFLSLHPVGNVTEENVRLVTPEVAIVAGLYNFTLDRKGSRKNRGTACARFSFVFRRKILIQGIAWEIVEHHSSVVPPDEHQSEDDERAVKDVLQKWLATLKLHSPETQSELYLEDAILHPTVSAKVRHNREEIRDYFEHFLALDPIGIVVEENVRLNGDTAINAGVYHFEVNDSEPGQRKAVRARYSFVYKRGDEGQWDIVEHHSSVLPPV